MSSRPPIVTLVFLLASLAVTQQPGFYGNLSFFGFSGMANDEYLGLKDGRDFSLSAIQDISLSFPVEEAGRVNCDLSIVGSLLNAKAGNDLAVAPMEISVAQLYALIPVCETVRFTVGKRVKSMGKAAFFPAVNRINPRSVSLERTISQGAGLVEFSCNPLDWCGVSIDAFFRDIESLGGNWADIGALGQVDLSLSPLDASVFIYREKDDEFPFGLSASLQFDYVTLYADYLYARKGGTAVLIDAGQLDPSKAFSERPVADDAWFPMGNHAITAGFLIALDDLSLQGEYSFDSDALSSEDASLVYEYLRNYENDFGQSASDVYKPVIFGKYLERQAFFPHNAKLACSYVLPFFKDISVRHESSISIPHDGNDPWAFFGYTGCLALAYSAGQSLQVSFSVQWRSGGAESEAMLLEDRKVQCAAVIKAWF